MRKTTTPTSEPGTFTVGDLIGELCRWPDNAAVTFRCPLQKQQLRFNRIEQRAKGSVEIELEQALESTSDRPRMTA
jgi:hypothetical protein